MAVDYFLKLDGIEGETTDAKHKGEIDVLSFSWGETNAATVFGAGRGAGKVDMQDFHFTMPFNQATPKLILACATGEHIKQAILTTRRAGKEQQEYLKITFSDVMVTSCQVSGGGDAVPMDSISLAYAKMEVTYAPQKVDGSLGSPVKVGWDLQKNAKL